MKRPKKLLFLVIAVSVMAALFAVASKPLAATAANPTTMSFQGKVVNADGTNVTDGTYSFVFKLYNVSSGGSALWTETQSSVTVAAGVFQVNLGSVCPLLTANACNGSTPIDFSTSNSLYLGITFNSDPAGEMTPRVQLQSVPFAFQADNAAKVGGLAVNQLVQLSPGSQQTGFINVSGAGTFGGGLSVTTGGASVGGLLAVTSSSASTNAALFTGAASATAPVVVLRGGATPQAGGDLLQWQDSSSTLLGAVQSDGVVNLAGVAGSAQYKDAVTSLGDKLELYSSTTFGRYGFGVQAFALVANVGAANGSFVVRVDPGTGQASSAASNIFSVSGTGNVVASGSITATSGLTVQGGGMAVTGNSTIAGTLSSLTGLTSSGTITFSGLNTAGVVHTNASGVLSTGAVALGTETSGNYVATLGTLTGLTTTGNTGAGSTPTLAVTYGSTASTAAQGNVTFTCPSGTGNLTGTGNAITIGSGGTCSSLTVVNNPTFSGLVTANGGLTVATGQNLTVNGSAYTDLAGQGLINSAGVLTVDTTTTGTTTTTSNNSGLETSASGLSLIRGCSNGQILKWTGGSSTWGCGTDNTGLSDSRLKTSVVNHGSLLDSIKGLRVVDYNFKCTDPTYLSWRFDCDLHTGVISQELQAVFPNLVHLDSDGYYEVDFGSLNFYTLQAVTQLANMINDAGNATFTALSSTGTLAVTGASTLAGITSSGTYNGNTFTSSALSFSGAAANTISGAANQALTVQSQGTGGLTLNSANGTLGIGSATSTIQRASAGNFTLDLSNAGATGLVLNNSGAGAASLVLTDGDLSTGSTPTVRLSNAGNLLNIGTITASGLITGSGYKAGTSSGLSVACTGTQYLPAPVFTGGILTGNAACAGIGLSDSRVKKDIVSLNNSVLDAIQGVNPVSFYYDCANSYFTTSNTYCDPTHQAGVIAQELQQIFPDLVTTDDYGYYHVDYQGLSAYTLKAVSEIAQHLDSQGNAQLHAVTADSLRVNGDLTVAGSVNYNTVGAADGSFSNSVVTPSLTANGALQIVSGASGDVTIDSGTNTTAVNIGTSAAGAVNISRVGQTTNVKGALVTDGAADFNGPVSMHFSSPEVSLKIDNNGSSSAVASAIEVIDSAGTGFGKVIKSTNFSVAGNGDVSTNGSVVSKGGTLQIIDASGTQAVSFDSNGNGTIRGSLNLSSATLTGGLNVGGDFDVAGLSTFQKLATFLGKTIFRQDVQFDGHITVAKDSAGYASLRATENTVHVAFEHDYAEAPIVSAAITNGVFAPYTIDHVDIHGFDITLKDPATADTKFSWTAIGVNSPVTAINPLPAGP